MSQLSIVLAIIFVFVFPVFEVSGSKFLQYLQIPMSKTCDFVNRAALNRNWMEGYYTQRKSYIRVYMSVFDNKGYPENKDIWQDHSGHIVIYPKGRLLWIGFGRPDRQTSFAKKYLKDGLKSDGVNEPLIRSFLVNADIITDISKRASIEKYSSRGLDLNVDMTKSSNQFGIGAVSTELLRQHALAHSLVTYYLKSDGQHSSWGKTKAVDVLEQRVTRYNMDREIPIKCDSMVQELFPIKQDIAFKDSDTNALNNAETESELYKQLLIRRQCILALTESIQEFCKIGGRSYRDISNVIVRETMKSPRMLEKFKLGEDLTKADVQNVENAIVKIVRDNRPANEADMALWGRVQSSVDQVDNFAKFAGTEIQLGNSKNIINDWDVLQNYQIFHMAKPGRLPKMQLIHASAKIGIRMDYNGGEDAVTISKLIKDNFIGTQVANLQLISPLYDSNDIFTYAKRLSDSLERNTRPYTERGIQSTLVTIYGTDGLEYRFYPDTQVAWSQDMSGTLLLFENGKIVNLCIKGYVFTVQEVLKTTLQGEIPQLYHSIEAKIKNQEDGLIIVPQQYINWLKPGQGRQKC